MKNSMDEINKLNQSVSPLPKEMVSSVQSVAAMLRPNDRVFESVKPAMLEMMGTFVSYEKMWSPVVKMISMQNLKTGIIATTSFFTNDAKKFIEQNHYGNKIQMHDFVKIKHLLNEARR